MTVDSMQEEGQDVSILLRYQGPAVDDGSMDVYQVAANMVAFSDFIVAAAHKLYGEDIKVRAEVNAFQQGSFVTELTFHAFGLAGAILTSVTPDLANVVNIVKESIELFSFLKGKSPEKVERTSKSNNLNVTNVNGNVIVVQTESLNLTLDEKAARSVEQFIGKALLKPGMNKLEITTDETKVAQVTSDVAEFYHSIEDEIPIIEQTLQMGLTILEPNFKDGTGNKWTMWDGEASLQFTMEDQEFLKAVDAGEPFRKGDVLICDVRMIQTKTGQKLKIQRVIVRVRGHRSAAEQANLDM